MRRVVILAAVCLALPAAVQAQHPQTRQGFGISFGIGGGSGGISCSGCSTTRESATSGYLRLGGYVSPSLFIGGESNGWMKSSNGVDETMSYISAVAQWYPQVSNGFYLKGGLGFAGARASDGVDEITVNGAGMTIGTGYDWRVARNFSLTPYVNYMRSMGGEVSANGTGTGIKANSDVVQLGLGFTWH